MKSRKTRNSCRTLLIHTVISWLKTLSRWATAHRNHDRLRDVTGTLQNLVLIVGFLCEVAVPISHKSCIEKEMNWYDIQAVRFISS